MKGLCGSHPSVAHELASRPRLRVLSFSWHMVGPTGQTSSWHSLVYTISWPSSASTGEVKTELAGRHCRDIWQRSPKLRVNRWNKISAGKHWVCGSHTGAHFTTPPFYYVSRCAKSQELKCQIIWKQIWQWSFISIYRPQSYNRYMLSIFR